MVAQTLRMSDWTGAIPTAVPFLLLVVGSLHVGMQLIHGGTQGLDSCNGSRGATLWLARVCVYSVYLLQVATGFHIHACEDALRIYMLAVTASRQEQDD